MNLGNGRIDKKARKLNELGIFMITLDGLVCPRTWAKCGQELAPTSEFGTLLNCIKQAATNQGSDRPTSRRQQFA
jgi:hypothetical protein